MVKELILVGTSHIARQSVDRVKAAIEDYKPDVVAVELDKDRYKSLLMEKNNQKIKSKFSFYDVKAVGVKGFVFAMVASWGMKKLAKYIGTNPGMDMLEAVDSAKKHNTKAALIDQNIRVTLKRFSKALSMKEIGRFLIDFIKGLFNPKGEMEKMGLAEMDLNKVPDEKTIEKMIAHMSKRYPSIHKVLVHERNIYMAKKIITMMQHEDINKVVAVVGAGHRKGMAKFLEDQPKATFRIKSI